MVIFKLSRAIFWILLLIFFLNSKSQAQKKNNYHWVAIYGGIQNRLKVVENNYNNLKRPFAIGADFDWGYSIELNNKFRISPSFGTSFFFFKYKFQSRIDNIDINTNIIDFKTIPLWYSLNLGVRGIYTTNIKERQTNVQLGLRFNFIPEIEYQNGVTIQGNSGQSHRIFDSRMEFDAMIRPVILLRVGIPPFKYYDKFLLNLSYNYSPFNLATGSFYFENVEHPSYGTTSYNGNSLGIEFIYKFKKKKLKE